jgi:hypothetical protein
MPRSEKVDSAAANNAKNDHGVYFAGERNGASVCTNKWRQAINHEHCHTGDEKWDDDKHLTGHVHAREAKLDQVCRDVDSELRAASRLERR